MSHKVKERLPSRYKGDVTLLNEGYSISVFTYEIHYAQRNKNPNELSNMF